MKILYCEDIFITLIRVLRVYYDGEILMFVVDSLHYKRYLSFKVNKKQAKCIMSNLLKSGFYDMTKFDLYDDDNFGY